MQILFVHGISYWPGLSTASRLGLAGLATAPWLLRGLFPVNRFSDNYTQGQQASALVPLLYRLKKYQYVFYKHALLHGLNVSVAVSGVRLAHAPYFRFYWMCLNTSYVMEFFLQTLVKKGYMGQQPMLYLQQLLMAASMVPAVQVLGQVYVVAAGTSLVLNFVHRKHDVVNTAITAAATVAYTYVGAVGGPGAAR